MDQTTCPRSINVEAQEALNKTKIHLMTKPGAIFLSSISLMLKHEITEEVPTASVDGKTIRYNPHFFLNQSKEERLGLLAHEVWHIAYNHLTRRNNRDALVWNMAGDYVINLTLTQNGFKIPKEGLLDLKFANWSTDQVYDFLIKQEKLPDFNTDIVEVSTSEQDIEDIKNVIVQATQAAIELDQYSKLPQEVLRKIDDLINPKISWQEYLIRYFNATTKELNSIKRPNKKFLPNFYLPSKYNENLDNIIIAIDTSGSVPKKLLTSFLSEIDFIHKTFKPSNLTIIDCDSQIHATHEIDDFTDIFGLTFKGHGGTSFQPVIDYCKQQHTNLLIYFTDLYGPIIREDPGYPVIWICYSKHEPAFIGTTIYAEY